MNFTQTQTTSMSIAWQYKHNIEVTPKGLKIKLVIGSTSATTSQTHMLRDPTHAMCEG